MEGSVGEGEVRELRGRVEGDGERLRMCRGWDGDARCGSRSEWQEREGEVRDGELSGGSAMELGGAGAGRGWEWYERWGKDDRICTQFRLLLAPTNESQQSIYRLINLYRENTHTRKWTRRRDEAIELLHCLLLSNSQCNKIWVHNTTFVKLFLLQSSSCWGTHYQKCDRYFHRYIVVALQTTTALHLVSV